MAPFITKVEPESDDYMIDKQGVPRDLTASSKDPLLESPLELLDDVVLRDSSPAESTTPPMALENMNMASLRALVRAEGVETSRLLMKGSIIKALRERGIRQGKVVSGLETSSTFQPFVSSSSPPARRILHAGSVFRPYNPAMREDGARVPFSS